jgi:hypothetical protein
MADKKRFAGDKIKRWSKRAHTRAIDFETDSPGTSYSK